MKDPHRLAAEVVLQQLEEREKPPVLQALADLIAERHPRRRGRQEGRDIHDDEPRLARVAELMRSGHDKESAIQQTAAESPSNSEKNTRRRLYLKFSRVLALRTDPAEQEKAETLRQAFDEDVEVWNL